MNYYDDAVRRCVQAVTENDGRPLGVWSTGEKVLVALTLWDREYLTGERYSYAEAMSRVADGIQVSRQELPGFLDAVRLEVEELTSGRDSEGGW